MWQYFSTSSSRLADTSIVRVAPRETPRLYRVGDVRLSSRLIIIFAPFSSERAAIRDESPHDTPRMFRPAPLVPWTFVQIWAKKATEHSNTIPEPTYYLKQIPYPSRMALQSTIEEMICVETDLIHARPCPFLLQSFVGDLLPVKGEQYDLSNTETIPLIQLFFYLFFLCYIVAPRHRKRSFWNSFHCSKANTSTGLPAKMPAMQTLTPQAAWRQH